MPFHTMPPWHTMKYHDNNITMTWPWSLWMLVTPHVFWPLRAPLLAMATLLIPAALARRPAPPPIRGSWRPLIMELLRRAAPGVPPGGGQGRTALGVLGLLPRHGTSRKRWWWGGISWSHHSLDVCRFCSLGIMKLWNSHQRHQG
jgi:hypothetical protein